MPLRLRLPTSIAARAGLAGVVAAGAIAAGLQFADAGGAGDDATKWPIKHVVVLFQENTSFDHVFGTYPNAANLPGEIPFTPAAGTPSINGLTPTLLTANPNKGNPRRIAPSENVARMACGNTHGYTEEQQAFNGGLMDKFVERTQGSGCGSSGVLDYVDGNTVTGLWNYANHYAMSQSTYGTGFGPSTIGAIELVSGNTATATDELGNAIASIPGYVNNGTIYNNLNPPAAFDGCSGGTTYALGAKSGAAALGAGNTSKNVGDLLNIKNVSWGWFQGGFTPTSFGAKDATYPTKGRPSCGASHVNEAGANGADYDPHHNPFSYYKSTSNPEHLPPTATIGDDDQANHNYDLSYFESSVAAGALPAVSFVKAGHYQDGHPGYSDPIDEQRFLVKEINAIENSPLWDSTAIFIAWDDSDGWYDHQSPPNVRTSSSPQDALSGPGQCGDPGAGHPVTNDRCGYGPRLPLLAISPYAKVNYVKSTANDQTSVLKFIEDNWNLGSIGPDSTDSSAASLESMFDFSAPKAGKLLLDPDTGAVPGTQRIPTPAPGATPTPAPAPAPTPTPAPVVQIPSAELGKLKAVAKRSGKRLGLTLTVKTAPSLKTTLRVRLYKGKTLLGTSSSANLKTVKHGKKSTVSATTSVSAKKALAKGKYSLVITISQPGRNPVTQTLSIKL